MTTQADQSYVYNVLTLYSLLSSKAATKETTKHDLYIRFFGKIICIHLISTEFLLGAKYLAKHSGHKHTGVCFHGVSWNFQSSRVHLQNYLPNCLGLDR